MAFEDVLAPISFDRYPLAVATLNFYTYTFTLIHSSVAPELSEVMGYGGVM